MDPSKTDTIVLCGGLGSRLKSVLPNLPKSMASINGKPFLAILLEYVVRFGFHRFVFCTGYKGNLIREYFASNKEVTIIFSEEKMPLGTGGAIKHCEGCLESDPFLVLNGDSICPVNLASLLDFHIKQDGIATVVAVPGQDRVDGGFLKIGEGNRILSFNEKQARESLQYFNAGIYVFNRKILDLIPETPSSSLEYEVFPYLLVHNQKVYSYLTTKVLFDIGTPERLEMFQTSQSMLSQRGRLA